MSCSFISAPPPLNNMTASYAIQPINTIIENDYKKINWIYIYIHHIIFVVAILGDLCIMNIFLYIEQTMDDAVRLLRKSLQQ